MRCTLSIDTVRAALQTLTATKSHEQLVLYLAILRLKSRDGQNYVDGDVYSVIKPWLELPGREDYPYYRPFASRGKQFWMNSNLAGSFAPSSLRSSRDLFYSSDSSDNALRLPSVGEITASLKIKSPVPLWAVTCYFLRNASFIAKDGDWRVADVLSLADDYFGINQADYSEVFDFNLPDDMQSSLEATGEDSEGGDALILEDESYRKLDAMDLGVEVSETESQRKSVDGAQGISLGSKTIDTNDHVLADIITALEAYSGVILSGAPGTSKSYYARRAAEIITGHDESRMSFVQFHPSYQFEDFVQGYRPCENGSGFEKRGGIFLKMCFSAAADPNKNPYVIVIDELSRGDSQRIFGEALTYIEKSKRGMEFTLPSGDRMTVPDNLYLIATMNPVDRGADDVDLAFGRRFGTIQMDPSTDILRTRLQELGCPGSIMGGVIEWMNSCNKTCSELELPGLGHAFFWGVSDLLTLKSSWRLQIKPHLHRLLRFEKDERDRLIREFETFLNNQESE